MQSTLEPEVSPRRWWQFFRQTPEDRRFVDNRAVRHLVITVHGIRDFGGWQESLETLLKRRDPSISVCNFKYGYFSILTLCIPFLRYLLVRRFRRDFMELVAQRPNLERLDIVGHSFGTHLIGWAIMGIPFARRPKIHTVILAGSVLRNTFPWEDLVAQGVVKRVINECGTRDWALLLSGFLVLGTGMAGRTGFYGRTSEQFRNRFHRFGHSDYFFENRCGYQNFMQEVWLPFLTGEEPIPTVPFRPTATERVLASIGNNMQPIKIVIWAALLFGFVVLPAYSMYQWHLEQQRLGVFHRILSVAQLSEASKFGNLDRQEVYQFLSTGPVNDGYLEPGIDEQTIHLAALSWNTLRGIDPDSLAEKDVRARLGGLTSTLTSQADKLSAVGVYVQSLIAYRSKDPQYDWETLHQRFSHAEARLAELGDTKAEALCHFDHGRILAERGDKPAAQGHFDEVRRLLGDALPPWMAVSLLSEEAAMKRRTDWEASMERLQSAVQIAALDGDIVRQIEVRRSRAWHYMDHLLVDDAENEFRQAARAIDAQKSGRCDLGALEVRRFHVQHGILLIGRFQCEEVAEGFNRLIREMELALSRRDEFTPKQRQEMRGRILNSYERAADAELLRPEPRPIEAIVGYRSALEFMAQHEDKLDLWNWRSSQIRLYDKLSIAYAAQRNRPGALKYYELARYAEASAEAPAGGAPRAPNMFTRMAAACVQLLSADNAEFERGRESLEQTIVDLTENSNKTLERDEYEALLLAHEFLLASFPGGCKSYERWLASHHAALDHPQSMMQQTTAADFETRRVPYLDAWRANCGAWKKICR